MWLWWSGNFSISVFLSEHSDGRTSSKDQNMAVDSCCAKATQLNFNLSDSRELCRPPFPSLVTYATRTPVSLLRFYFHMYLKRELNTRDRNGQITDFRRTWRKKEKHGWSRHPEKTRTDGCGLWWCTCSSRAGRTNHCALLLCFSLGVRSLLLWSKQSLPVRD